jgi:putative ABC transport system permease protein
MMVSIRRVFKEQLPRLQGSLRRRSFEGEFDEEVEAHLASLTERFVRRGMSIQDARYAARKQFGGITQMKNALRDRRRFRPFEEIRSE